MEPVARRIVELPLHIVTSGLAVTFGFEMITITVELPVHPVASVTVSVYVVVPDGQTETFAPDRFPGFQL
jgi:hypothetical protein